MPGVSDAFAARLDQLSTAARLVFFTQTFECGNCLTERLAVDKIASLSDQITVEEHNLILDKNKASLFNIDRAPALAIVGEYDLGIRFYGAPEGSEMASIVEAILMAATGDTGLSDESLAAVASVNRAVDIKVFVTPTCAYCPKAVVTAYRLAVASDQIMAAAIDVTEYPDLAQKYRVTGVPKTIVDNQVEIFGIETEESFIREVLCEYKQKDHTFE